MSRNTDTTTVELFVNGEQAEEAMKRLQKEADDLGDAIAKALAAGDKKQAGKLQRQLDQVNKELKRTESAAKGTGIVLENLSGSSIHGLRNALKYLEKQLKNTKPDSERWKQLADDINMVKGRIAELNQELDGKESLWGRFKKWADDVWPALDLLSSWIRGFIGSAQSLVDAYASMDQEMANVRKFTGMTESRVAALNEEFKKLDTRTSREELNKLAQEAGRLGKSSIEDVLGFVRAADKINVALDDLGEGATLTLSKLTGVFGVESMYGTEQSLLKVGSVINELSQNCSAAAPYLSNFAERMGGVGAQAGLTIQQIMGFAAVLDSNGQAVEASSTALSQVIVRMMQEPAKYAKVAGLDVKKFSDMLRTDVNGALILFLETLQKAGGMDVLSPMFKDMGENGSRAIASLSTLAMHIDQVRRQQDAANLAFEEGSSIDKEFAVQNNTVAAALEKCKNRANELRVELGEQIQPLMRHMLVSGSSLIRGILTTIKYLKENITSVIAVASAVAAYTIILKVHSLWLDRVAVKTMLADKATKAWAVTQKALSGIIAVTRLAVAALTNSFLYFKNGLSVTYAMQERWRKSMEGMKFASWTGLILALAAAVFILYKRMTSLSAVQKAVNDAQQQAVAETADEVTKIRQLQSIVEDNNRTLWERHRAIVQLKSIMADYNASLDTEGRLINHNTSLIDAYIKKLRERALAAALEDQMKQTFQTLVENGLEILNSSKGVKGDNSQMEQFRSDLLSGNISGSMFLKGKAARGGDASFMSGAKSYAPVGYDNMRTFAWNVPLLQDGTQDAIDNFNEALGVFLSLSEMVDENARKSLVSKDDGAPKVDQSRYEKDEQYKKAVDELSATLKAAIDAAGDDQKKKDVAQYQFQVGLYELNTKKAAVDVVPDENPKPPERTQPVADRFAEEKAWRERQEAEARIAYARGEDSYSEHYVRMEAIAVQYYQKILDREDVFGDERLKIMAEYEETVNKEADAERKVRVEDENRSYQDLLDRLRANHRKRLDQESMSAQDRQREAEYYDEVLELAELKHLEALLAIYDKGSTEWLDTQRSFQEKELAAQERHLKRSEKQLQMYADIKKKVFGMNQNEKDAEFSRQFDALTAVYNQELAAVGDNEAEKLRIKEAYMAAELALRKEYNQEGAEDSSSAYESAIAKSVEWLQGDGGKALSGTLSTLTSGMSSIFSGLSSMMQAELEIQTAKIEKRYDREIEMAQGNSYKVAKLEKKKEKEIAQAKNEANKKMFAMQVIQAVAQTAQNAISAYGSAAAIPVVGHILAPVAAAMAVAAGAIQIAAIKKQQKASEAQGYSKGGFTKPGAVDEPAGIVHAGEWVASQKLLASPVARPMIEALDYAQRTNTIGSLRPDDVSRSITANNSLVRIAESNDGSALMVAAAVRMSQTVDSLTNRLNEPFVTVNTVTGDFGSKQANDEYTRLMNNITPKSKRKK